MPQNIYNCTPPEGHWKWKDLYNRDLQTGAKLASQQQKTMTNSKRKIEVPGYTKENIKVSIKRGFPSLDTFYMFEENSSETYLYVEAENEEFGKKSVNIFPEENIDVSSVRAEVKNGILYLDWDIPKELAPVTIRVD